MWDDRILVCRNPERMRLRNAIENMLPFNIGYTNQLFNIGYLPLASKSYLIRLRTAAHGRSVFSKQRHHSKKTDVQYNLDFFSKFSYDE